MGWRMRLGNDQLIDSLKRILGLNEYEARAYTVLLTLGEAKALTIANASGVPTGRIYDVLRSLIHKGLVTKTEKGYKIISPKNALEEYASKIMVEAEERAGKVRELAIRLDEITGAFVEGEEIRYIYGLESSISSAITVLKDCRKHPIYFTVYKAGEKLDEIWPLIKRLLENDIRGIRILVAPGLRPGKERVALLKALEFEIREHPCVFFDSMIACDTVIIGFPSKTHTVVSAYIKQVEFAGALRERFEWQWGEGRIPSWYV